MGSISAFHASPGSVRSRMVLLFAALVAVLLAPTSVTAAPDRSAKLVAGTTFSWTGAKATGVNGNYYGTISHDPSFPVPKETCTRQAQTYCEVLLLEFVNPLTEREIQAGTTTKTRTAKVELTFQRGEFHLHAFASDAAGTKGARLDRDGWPCCFQFPSQTSAEVSFPVVTSAANSSAFVLVEVVYYRVIDSGYLGRASF